MGIFPAEMLSYTYEEKQDDPFFYFFIFNHGSFCYAKYVY